MKVVVHTLGCRVNQYESQMIRQQLAGLPGDGELHVVNTCTVTSLADRKGRKLVRQLKRRHPDALVVAVGCQVDAARDQLLSAGADLVFGNRLKLGLRETLTSAMRGQTGAAGGWPPLDEERAQASGRTRALLKVQDGCSVGCTFCRTWQVRGPVRSKSPRAAREEAEALAAAGHRELVVVGVNLAQYGLDLPGRPALPQLLQELLKVNGVRLRLSSLSPQAITPQLVELFSACSRLAPYFHLPLQSGDDRVLARMGRPYSAALFRDRAEVVLTRVANATLGADVMVGFPGEDESAFARTRALLEKLEPLNVHVFRYSPRPGTAAATMTEQVPAQVRARRAAELADAARRWAARAAGRFLGRTLQVLLERQVDGYWWGRAENYLPVGVRATGQLRGTMVWARPLRAGGGRTLGVMVDRPEDE
ncbi:MAG: MiaB/RimO family radical SAM methylthiotransferase [Candidatus Bipolaricaulaceae bacterium]